ncbi:hypothetical protein ACEWWX_000407 [Salmonella enterica]
MGFDIELYRKITRQVLCDMSRVWYFRKLLFAKYLHEEGATLDELAEEFNVKESTIEKYLKKVEEAMTSKDPETQYKLYVALETPDKHSSPEAMDNITGYVYKFELYKEEWFFKF